MEKTFFEEDGKSEIDGFQSGIRTFIRQEKVFRFQISMDNEKIMTMCDHFQHRSYTFRRIFLRIVSSLNNSEERSQQK